MRATSNPLSFGGPLLRSKGLRGAVGGTYAGGPLRPKKVGVPEEDWAERAVAKASVVATRAALTAQHTAVAAVAAGIVRDEVDVRVAIERAVRSVDAAKDASVAYDEARRALAAAQQAQSDSWSSAQQKLMSAELVAQRLRPEIRDAVAANLEHMQEARKFLDEHRPPLSRDIWGREISDPLRKKGPHGQLLPLGQQQQQQQHAVQQQYGGGALASHGLWQQQQQHGVRGHGHGASHAPQSSRLGMDRGEHVPADFHAAHGMLDGRAPAEWGHGYGAPLYDQRGGVVPPQQQQQQQQQQMGQVIVPRGYGPGDVVETMTPEGRSISVTIPAEHYEGSTFLVGLGPAQPQHGGVAYDSYRAHPYGRENGL